MHLRCKELKGKVWPRADVLKHAVRACLCVCRLTSAGGAASTRMCNSETFTKED